MIRMCSNFCVFACLVEYLYTHIKKVVDDIGPENVVQLVGFKKIWLANWNY
jgi:hypothetical protein